jgi:ADP-ribose pyrophosphatase YjhB (NUDIX family)
MSTDRSRNGRSEFSAGGVVVRGGEVITIVPVKRAGDGRRVLGLPKGHPDGDETPEQAELVEELGDVEYDYERGSRRIHKVVKFFLFDYRSGDLADHDHEIEEARWMALTEAARELTFPGEREIVHRALSRGAADR